MNVVRRVGGADPNVECEALNSKYPVGTHVLYEESSIKHTRTVSEIRLAADGLTPCVILMGVYGEVPVSKLKILK